MFWYFITMSTCKTFYIKVRSPPVRANGTQFSHFYARFLPEINRLVLFREALEKCKFEHVGQIHGESPTFQDVRCRCTNGSHTGFCRQSQTFTNFTVKTRNFLFIQSFENCYDFPQDSRSTVHTTLQYRKYLPERLYITILYL